MAMSKAQEIIQRMHQEIGVSDTDIAYMCDVSREHINRIKRNKERASEHLTSKLADLLQRMIDTRYSPERKHYDRKRVAAQAIPAHSHSAQAPGERAPIQKYIPSHTGMYGNPYS